MMTSNEVTIFSAFKEADLTIFFKCFLIVHLARNRDMDGYLGFTTPNPYATLLRTAKPKIAVHLLRSV